MKRADVVIAADGSGGDFAGKPRPYVVVQSDLFTDIASVTLCPLTSENLAANIVRIGITPSEENNLRAQCWAMVDKITTVRRARLSRVVGAISATDMERIDQALLIFFGLAD